MNLFNPPKYVSNKSFKIKFGQHPFIILAGFIFTAKNQKFTKDEIKKVIDEAKSDDYKHLVKTVKSHISD